MNINTNKFGQPAILASKQCSLLTVSRGVSVKHARTGHLRIADADGKMRMEKCGKNKTRNADGKNKQRKEIFLSRFCHMVGPFMYSMRCQ